MLISKVDELRQLHEIFMARLSPQRGHVDTLDGGRLNVDDKGAIVCEILYNEIASTHRPVVLPSGGAAFEYEFSTSLRGEALAFARVYLTDEGALALDAALSRRFAHLEDQDLRRRLHSALSSALVASEVFQPTS